MSYAAHLQAHVLCNEEVQEDGDIPLLAELPCKALQAQVCVLVQRQRVDQAAHVLIHQCTLAIPAHTSQHHTQRSLAKRCNLDKASTSSATSDRALSAWSVLVMTCRPSQHYLLRLVNLVHSRLEALTVGGMATHRPHAVCLCVCSTACLSCHSLVVEVRKHNLWNTLLLDHVSTPQLAQEGFT